MTKNLSDIFGEQVDIPAEVALLVANETVLAFKQENNLILYFPDIFSNQVLTPIYDKVSEVHPDSEAGRNRHDMRYIKIRNFGLNATKN